MEKSKFLLPAACIMTCAIICVYNFTNIEWKHVPSKVIAYNRITLKNILHAIKSARQGLSPFSYNSTNLSNKSKRKKIIISFYTTFFGERPWEYFYPKNDYEKECGFSLNDCILDYNISNWKNADVVFFHGRNMPSSHVLRALKKQGKSGQLWVYFIMENPYNTPPVDPIADLFELSSSYRFNSDFFLPYGYYDVLTKSEMEAAKNIHKNYAEGKTGQIVWTVSHCGTIRDKLAYKFQEMGLKIDVAGGCSKNFNRKIHCERNTRTCQKILEKYKFYFSGENNLCENYITEKYWGNPFQINAIPITLGGSNYSDERLAIPGSFINALDFNSPKELIEYIKLLDSNDTLYNGYFQWKKKYKLRIEPRGCRKMLHHFCENLQAGIKLRKNPVKADINIEKDCGKQEAFFHKWINR